MSELLTGSTRSFNAKQMKEQRQRIIDSWSGATFLDGLSGHVKENIAQLYECQACSLLNEVDEDKPMPIVKKVLDQIGDHPIVSTSLPKDLHTYIKKNDDKE